MKKVCTQLPVILLEVNCIMNFYHAKISFFIYTPISIHLRISILSMISYSGDLLWDTSPWWFIWFGFKSYIFRLYWFFFFCLFLESFLSLISFFHVVFQWNSFCWNSLPFSNILSQNLAYVLLFYTFFNLFGSLA